MLASTKVFEDYSLSSFYVYCKDIIQPKASSSRPEGQWLYAAAALRA